MMKRIRPRSCRAFAPRLLTFTSKRRAAVVRLQLGGDGERATAANRWSSVGTLPVVSFQMQCVLLSYFSDPHSPPTKLQRTATPAR
jgi:hypothetical protein